MEAVGCALDQREEALASRRNVRAMLNVVRRPETLRSGTVPLVEKCFESLQHESLILFLDCLRHFILLRHIPLPGSGRTHVGRSPAQRRVARATKARPPASVS